MRLDKGKECFKDKDLVVLTCYRTLHWAHPKHCSASPGALWDGHLLLHPTVDEKKKHLSLNPEAICCPLQCFTVEATLNKQVNYPHWTLPGRMLPSTACCCCYRSCETVSRYLPKKQQVISPGSYNPSVFFLMFVKLRKKGNVNSLWPRVYLHWESIKFCALPWAHRSCHPSESRRTQGFSGWLLLHRHFSTYDLERSYFTPSFCRQVF